MDDESKLVTEKLEDQTYFSEALNWYASRYTFAQTQFAQLLIVASIAIVSFILVIIGFFSFLPVNEKEMFVIYNHIAPETSTRVEQLMNAGEDPDHALIKYFVREFVQAREEYVIDRSERDFNFVSRLSGENVLQDYLNAISPDNPSSPYIVYSNRGRRDVIINTMKFSDDKGNYIRHAVPKGKAVVTYTAIENFGSLAIKSSEYVANLEFDYRKIEVDQKTHQLTRKPEMIITNYSTKINSGPTK